MLRNTWKSGLTCASCAISARCLRPRSTAEIERCSLLSVAMDSFMGSSPRNRGRRKRSQPPGRTAPSAPGFGESDRRRREVGDAAEERPEVELADARDGILV